MDRTVFADSTGNCHFTQRERGENERLDVSSKEGKGFESLRSKQKTNKNNRKNDLHIKELYTSSSSSSTSQHQQEDSSPSRQLEDPNSKDKSSETLNSENRHKGESSKRRNVNHIVEDINTSRNSYLKSSEDAISIQLIAVNVKTQKNEARLSRKSISSDEYFDCVSSPSQSVSPVMYASKHRSDLFDRKGGGGSSPVIRDRHVSKSSSELDHSSRAGSVSDKEHVKKKISFRALVRMKGLGRKLRRKTKHKQIHTKSESHAKDPLFFSDSSAKYLLETSTGAADEHKHTNVATEGEAKSHKNKFKSYSFSGTSTPDHVFPSDDELSSDSIECSAEYLEQRRFAVCEEIEKTIICGEQSLAELRSILVIQHKLTGFGLL